MRPVPLLVTALFCALLGAESSSAAGFLADRHAARGAACASCHKDGPASAVDMTECLACHGGSYAKLAQRTDKSDINPHETHLGEAQCTACHAGHRAPQLACDNCHEFPDIKVP